MKYLPLALLLVVVGCKAQPDRPAAPPEDPPASAGTPTSESATVSTPTPGALDDSETIRVVPLGTGEDFILGIQGELLWGARMSAKGPVLLWRIKTPGTLQRAAGGILDGEQVLVVGFGRGRGRLYAPLSVIKLDPVTGATRTLARWESPRADFAHLSISDAQQDGSEVLVYAAYESKYVVREWVHPAGGGERIPRSAVRMATSRSYADLDGDGKAEQIIGRIYGDTQNAPGDLRVRYASDGREELLPVVGGVRSLRVAQRTTDSAPTLYYADGWSANYAREGRAQLRRAERTDGEWQAPVIARSEDEYTFNAIHTAGIPGKHELLLYGSKRLSWLRAGKLTTLNGPGGRAFPMLAHLGDDAWFVAAGAPTLAQKGPNSP
ncbi:MAG: hypothetical protein AAF654_03930 [Myxococcota bacterium]